MYLVRGEWDVLFGAFKSSAFRLEVHQVYSVPGDCEGAVWRDIVRQSVARGRSVTRVKVVRRPLTDSVREQISGWVPDCVGAGEEYRIVDVTHRGVALPCQDFWLFDESVGVRLDYRLDGSLLGGELVEGADIEQYLEWRDIAIKESVSFGEFGG